MAAVVDWTGVKLGATPYRITRRIGESPVAELFQAEDLHNGQNVVVKAVKPEVLRQLPVLAERLRQEYPILKRFQHPHLVPVLDQSEWSGRPFLVVPAFPAGSLGIRMSNRPGPKPAEHLAAWLPSIAAALDYVHAQGQVHGDVTPANILFDKDGQACLSELGLTRPHYDAARRAFFSGPGQTLSHYLAPELLAGRPSDGRADQFALALIAWEWLTGRSLFSGDSLAEIKKGHEALGRLPNWAPATWIPVLQQALALRPEERFAGCGEFAATLLRRMDASGAPLPEGGDNFDLFCADSVTALGDRKPTVVEVGRLAGAAGRIVPPALPLEAPPAVPLYTGPEWAEPSAAGPFEDPEPRAQSWLSRAAVLLMLLGGAVGMAILLSPGMPLGSRVNAMWTSNKSTGAEKTIPPSVAGPVAPDSRALEEKLAAAIRELNETKAGAERLKDDLTKARDELGRARSDDMGLDKLRAELKDEIARRLAADERARTEASSGRKLKEEAEGLSRRIRDLEARAAEPRKDDGSRVRAENAERDLATARADLEGARRRINRAEAAHNAFKVWFLVQNHCEFAITFQTRTQFWDGSWSDWVEHKVEPGQNYRIWCQGNIGAEAKWVNSLTGDAVTWGSVFVTGEIRPAAADPSVDMLDCRYRFVLRGRRIDLDFLYSVAK